MAFPSSVTGFARATFPIPFVPSGHFPLTRGIGPNGGGKGDGRNGLPRRPAGPPRNDRWFQAVQQVRLGSPCGGAVSEAD